MDSDNCADHRGLRNISKKSGDVSEYYDKWADEYEETLAKWHYDAPEQVALMLRTELPQTAALLDAGCGTGLSGKALRSAGFSTIDGIDVSSRSLEIAGRSDVYRTLCAVDMQQPPFPIESDKYDGLVCVGVLTYLADSLGTLREFSRMVRSGGIIVMTQRSDLFLERNFRKVLDTLSKEGVFGSVRISEPRPYLPENEEFADKLLVHYIACTVV